LTAVQDRFVLAATIDRLIYGDGTSFDPDDARTLLDSVPHKRSPWLQLGVAGKFSGGSTRGYAAGVGDVRVDKDKERQFQYATGADASTRVGQWKLMWFGKRQRQFIEIEQVMADVIDEGRGALVSYDASGTPLRMDIRFNRSFRLFWSPIVIIVPGWRPWKKPSLLAD
jgi:hypothetical protein